MIALEIQVPFATFRKSFARSYAETYALAPPATVYGMLLSLVGERYRKRHNGVRLAFAYRRIPRIATTLRKLSRLKYGVAAKQSTLGNAPDYIESLCDLDFICWIDSIEETQAGDNLESRVREALEDPASISRYGILSLGLSDDAVDSIRQVQNIKDDYFRLLPDSNGSMELPVWVDHVGSAGTRWRRYNLDELPVDVSSGPDRLWELTPILQPN